MQYPIPVDDFGFDILNATPVKQEQYVRSRNFIRVDSNVVVESDETELSPGESIFIPYSAQKYYMGKGRVARAYN